MIILVTMPTEFFNFSIKFARDVNYLKLYAHGMRPLRFLGACVWFYDVTSFSDASGRGCVRVEPVSILTHQTHCPGFRKERW